MLLVGILAIGAKVMPQAGIHEAISLSFDHKSGKFTPLVGRTLRPRFGSTLHIVASASNKRKSMFKNLKI